MMPLTRSGKSGVCLYAQWHLVYQANSRTSRAATWKYPVSNKIIKENTKDLSVLEIVKYKGKRKLVEINCKYGLILEP